MDKKETGKCDIYVHWTGEGDNTGSSGMALSKWHTIVRAAGSASAGSACRTTDPWLEADSFLLSQWKTKVLSG
jgi:hypothetical protein